MMRTFGFWLWTAACCSGCFILGWIAAAAFHDLDEFYGHTDDQE